jgi:threonine dehydrogenase-like Zn-dependent dehydrogenase
MARLRGARVFASDIVDFKLEKAKTLGAEETGKGNHPGLIDQIRSWTNGRGADVVIEAAGSSATTGQAFSCVRRGGTILLLGLTGHEKEEVYLERVTLDELNVAGTMRYAQGDFQRAIGMLQQEKVDLDALILRRFALAEAPQVLRETLQSPERVLRSVMIA